MSDRPRSPTRNRNHSAQSKLQLTATTSAADKHPSQVEANLMSAALLGTGTHVMELHNQVLARELPERKQPYKKTLRPMVRGIASAWGLYDRPGSVFLFLGELF